MFLFDVMNGLLFNLRIANVAYKSLKYFFKFNYKIIFVFLLSKVRESFPYTVYISN